MDIGAPNNHCLDNKEAQAQGLASTDNKPCPLQQYGMRCAYFGDEGLVIATGVRLANSNSCSAFPVQPLFVRRQQRLKDNAHVRQEESQKLTKRGQTSSCGKGGTRAAEYFTVGVAKRLPSTNVSPVDAGRGASSACHRQLKSLKSAYAKHRGEAGNEMQQFFAAIGSPSHCTC